MPFSLRSSNEPLCLGGIGSVLGLFLVAGCSSPNPPPFQEFSKATAGVSTATNKALKESIAESRVGLIESIRDLQGLNGLKLYFRSEPGAYTWGNQPDGSWKDVTPSLTETVPREENSGADLPYKPGPNSSQWINYYYKPQRITAEIDDFNQSLAQYATLLNSLANKEFLSDDEFKKMAVNLNARVGEIARRAGISAPKETAIFSASALALFEQYLKSRQKGVLRRAITENTAQIRSFSLLGQQLTFLLSVPVQRGYGQAFDDLARQFEAARTDSGRQRLVKSAVALNDSMIDRWELFSQMDAIYQHLPDAHEELAKAIDGKGGFSAVLEMAHSADRLQKIYESLNASNEKAAKAEARKQEDP